MYNKQKWYDKILEAIYKIIESMIDIDLLMALFFILSIILIIFYILLLIFN